MAVRAEEFGPDYDVAPHAVIWRPLRYFTRAIRQGTDDLDEFQGASFSIGNEIKFDLRVYRGHLHPEATVTLYLPEELTDERRISDTISKVVDEMSIPSTAVAWRRGQEFEYGELNRPPGDRLHAKEARLLALKIASAQPRSTVTVEKLREEILNYFDLSPIDLSPAPSRKKESLWHTAVRNAISLHEAGTDNIFAQGLAVKTQAGLTVTRRGLDYLTAIGFVASPASALAEA